MSAVTGPDPFHAELTAPRAGEILVIDRDDPLKRRNIDEQADHLLEALVDKGHEEVFLALLDIYKEQFDIN